MSDESAAPAVDVRVLAVISLRVDPAAPLGRICGAVQGYPGESCKIVIDDDEGHLEIPVVGAVPGKFLTDGRRIQTDDAGDPLPLEEYS